MKRLSDEELIIRALRDYARSQQDNPGARHGMPHGPEYRRRAKRARTLAAAYQRSLGARRRA